MNKGINFLTILISVTQIYRIIGASITKLEIEDVRQPKIDCSQYINDNHITDLFPFTVHINPITQTSTTTFAKMNKNYNIISMKIVNKKCVPSIIYCLKHLSKLEVINTSFCDFKQGLPAEIEYFASSLIHLHIYNTTITHLPEQIGKLKNLQTLKFSDTGLTSLPDSIGNLRSLNFLFLSNNNLTSLPVTIKNLQALQQITLANNPYLHSVQSLNGLPALRILNTKHCLIQILPRNLPQLTDLYMSNNNLTKLTGIETLGNGTNTRKSFYFDKNHIRTISPRIQYVRNLYRLHLYQNELDNLPTDIFNITTLSYLNIQRNDFSPEDLKTIVSKFHDKIPNLNIVYK